MYPGELVPGIQNSTTGVAPIEVQRSHGFDSIVDVYDCGRLAVGELLRVLAEMRGADVYLRLQG